MNGGAIFEPGITRPQYRHRDDNAEPDVLKGPVLQPSERVLPDCKREHTRSDNPATYCEPKRKRCVEETHKSYITRLRPKTCALTVPAGIFQHATRQFMRCVPAVNNRVQSPKRG